MGYHAERGNHNRNGIGKESDAVVVGRAVRAFSCACRKRLLSLSLKPAYSDLQDYGTAIVCIISRY